MQKVTRKTPGNYKNRGARGVDLLVSPFLAQMRSPVAEVFDRSGPVIAVAMLLIEYFKAGINSYFRLLGRIYFRLTYNRCVVK